MLNECAPGVYAWETKDMKRFRAFAVTDGEELVLIDPVMPDDGELKALQGLGRVSAILLTNTFHERDSKALAAQLGGLPVYGDEAALSEFENKAVRPFPATLPVGLEALRADGGLGGEVCFYLARDGGTLIAGDAWHNLPLSQKPFYFRWVAKAFIKLRDGLHPTPPSKVQDSPTFMRSLQGMLERPVERLLVSHGDHLTANAREQLRARLARGV